MFLLLDTVEHKSFRNWIMLVYSLHTNKMLYAFIDRQIIIYLIFKQG